MTKIKNQNPYELVDVALIYARDGAPFTAADRLERAAAIFRASGDEINAAIGAPARPPTPLEVAERQNSAFAALLTAADLRHEKDGYARLDEAVEAAKKVARGIT